MRISVWQKLPIRWKLILTIVSVSTIVSICQIIVYSVYDYQVFLAEKKIKVRAIAEIMGINSLAALQFRHRGDALEILRSLVAVPSIEAAYLFYEDGGLLAEYLRSGAILGVPMIEASDSLESLSSDHYVLIHRIISDGKAIGSLYISSDLEDIEQKRRQIILLSTSLGLIVFGLSIILAFSLQRSFTVPINNLVTTIQRITRDKDYTARAPECKGDEFGILVDGFNHMVTEIGQRDYQLAKQMSMLGRTNKELDQFVYVASHDLKAPLRGVENIARLITKAVKDILPADKQELLVLLQTRVKRMELLLDDLLTYSRVGRVQAGIEMVDCKLLLKDIINLLAPPSSFTFNIKAELAPFKAARVPLEQVLRNLIGNAIKHSAKGAAQIEIEVRDLGTEFEFSVKDDGQGIAAQYHEKIFQMFQTLKPRDQVEGSGMGLALVKKIVEERGGKVWVESSEGKGAAFYFKWPKV